MELLNLINLFSFLAYAEFQTDNKLRSNNLPERTRGLICFSLDCRFCGENFLFLRTKLFEIFLAVIMVNVCVCNHQAEMIFWFQVKSHSF